MAGPTAKKREQLPAKDFWLLRRRAHQGRAKKESGTPDAGQGPHPTRRPGRRSNDKPATTPRRRRSGSTTRLTRSSTTDTLSGRIVMPILAPSQRSTSTSPTTSPAGFAARLPGFAVVTHVGRCRDGPTGHR